MDGLRRSRKIPQREVFCSSFLIASKAAHSEWATCSEQADGVIRVRTFSHSDQAHFDVVSSGESRMTNKKAKSFRAEQILPTARAFDRSIIDRPLQLTKRLTLESGHKATIAFV